MSIEDLVNLAVLALVGGVRALLKGLRDRDLSRPNVSPDSSAGSAWAGTGRSLLTPLAFSTKMYSLGMLVCRAASICSDGS